MHRKGRGRAARAAGAVGCSLAVIALSGACGEPASEAKATSLADVLGIDEATFEEREAKVQEEIRKCMQQQGFEYVPRDMTGMKVVRRAPGQDDNAEFRRTKGYGITTGFGEAQAVQDDAGSDPNQAIREQLSDAEKEAYDRALFGAAAKHVGGSGEVSVRIGPGVRMATRAGSEASDVEEPQDTGCFGKAQEAVGQNDRIREIGPKLQELQQRIESDPRMVKANAAWSTCMADAGFDYEKPEDIVPYLFERLQELRGGAETTDGPVEIGPGGAPEDSPELDALRAEELALARADDGCSESTGRRETAADVREEAERRFLEENPDLGADRSGEG